MTRALSPQSTMVADMSGLAEPGKTDYVHRLLSTAEAHREQYGFPHWVIYDEAHLLGNGEKAHWVRRGGSPSQNAIPHTYGTATNMCER
jgi:hypothetical protein